MIEVGMSTGIQKASIPEPFGAAQALSALDGRILAMIMGQSPLLKTLEALCADIEQQDRGMLCSVLLLEADGVSFHNGADPRLAQEYTRDLDGMKIGACAGWGDTAIHPNQPVIALGLAADPLWAEHRKR